MVSRRGSARSVTGFDIYEALKRCEGKLLQFGGHKYAAGVTVDLSRVEEFRTAFNAAVKELMKEEFKTPEIRIDLEITLSEITPWFIKLLREFAPFGPNNTRPTFLTRNLEVAGTPALSAATTCAFAFDKTASSLTRSGSGW